MILRKMKFYKIVNCLLITVTILICFSLTVFAVTKNPKKIHNVTKKQSIKIPVKKSMIINVRTLKGIKTATLIPDDKAINALLSLNYKVSLANNLINVDPDIVKAVRQSVYTKDCENAYDLGYMNFISDREMIIQEVNRIDDTHWKVNILVKTKNGINESYTNFIVNIELKNGSLWGLVDDSNNTSANQTTNSALQFSQLNSSSSTIYAKDIVKYKFTYVNSVKELDVKQFKAFVQGIIGRDVLLAKYSHYNYSNNGIIIIFNVIKVDSTHWKICYWDKFAEFPISSRDIFDSTQYPYKIIEKQADGTYHVPINDRGFPCELYGETY